MRGSVAPGGVVGQEERKALACSRKCRGYVANDA